MKFTLEDFEWPYAFCFSGKTKEMSEIQRNEISLHFAEIANAKLAQWLAAAPTVYNTNGSDMSNTRHWWTGDPVDSSSHKAKLVCIEELFKLKGPIKI